MPLANPPCLLTFPPWHALVVNLPVIANMPNGLLVDNSPGLGTINFGGAVLPSMAQITLSRLPGLTELQISANTVVNMNLADTEMSNGDIFDEFTTIQNLVLDNNRFAAVLLRFASLRLLRRGVPHLPTTLFTLVSRCLPHVLARFC